MIPENKPCKVCFRDIVELAYVKGYKIIYISTMPLCITLLLQGMLLVWSSDVWLIMFISLFAILGILLTAYLYLRQSLEFLWFGEWGEEHTSKAQKQRIKECIKNPPRVIRMNKSARYAKYMREDGGQYVTRLCDCTCPDQQKRKRPCVHIYHLAKEMGIQITDYLLP